MSTCKNCKWWKPNRIGSYRNGNSKSSNIYLKYIWNKKQESAKKYINIIDSKFGNCEQGQMQHVEDTECVDFVDLDLTNKTDGIVYSDNGFSAVYTGKDFGCIHFEAKD